MSKPAPVLRQFAQLWTLTHQPSAEKEWTRDEKFKQAKKAGFDAMGGRVFEEIPGLCEKHGLEYVCYTDAERATYKDKLEAVKSMRPARVNVQLCDHDTPPKEAAAVWLKLEPLAEKMGLLVDLEVHRDTCTETPEKVYEIATLYRKATGKKLRFCWDFSHIAVVKHLSPPYAERLLTHPDLVRLSRQFHFRPFNGHHCQVPMTDRKGEETPEFKAYWQFVDALLACWMQGAKGGEVFYACPEFGPVASGYGLSVFSDSWKDAIRLRAKTEDLWKANLKRWWKG
jgi:hypothetical protein